INEQKLRGNNKVFFKNIIYGPENSILTNLGYIDSIIENVRILSILLDSKSTINIINLTFIKKYRILRVEI
ncbi:hypothetical protein CCUS01_03248, partial [Colletotrichum cuscutae]